MWMTHSAPFLNLFYCDDLDLSSPSVTQFTARTGIQTVYPGCWNSKIRVYWMLNTVYPDAPSPLCHVPPLLWDLSRILHGPATKGKIPDSEEEQDAAPPSGAAWPVMKWFECQPCPRPYTQFYQYLRLFHLWNDMPLNLYSNPSILSFHFSYSFALLGLFFHLTEPPSTLSVPFALRLTAFLHLHLLLY